ncbi:aminotransferase class I/II-fold pyridoxal phosphate-dependent enzyme [Bacteroidota bacterium]
MKDTPINNKIVKQKIKESGISCLGKATIREIVKLVNSIEEETGEKFIRMEMGVPGLPAPEIGIKAEIKALKAGVASKYAMIDGLPELKKEISRFAKMFLNIEVEEKNCLPTVGAMQGGFASFLMVNRVYKERETTLFIDPGFPVQKQQINILGQKYFSFDVYEYRGDKLKDKIESYLKTGEVSSIIYSNPNNPSWICFSEDELKIIGELATKYNAIVIEDLAYFGMDFRKDYSKPGRPPYQPTVANYTDNYVLLISSSKVFSFAGERVGSLIISNALYDRKFPDLKRFYKTDTFGYTLVYGAFYPLSAGVNHSAQVGMAAMFRAVNDGKFNFVEDLKKYGERAKIMKKLFTDNGFNLVYDKDEYKPIADGFYFTIFYPGKKGMELINDLIYYGISAIALEITGSQRLEGLRACVSQVKDSQLKDLEYRLKRFNEDHS